MTESYELQVLFTEEERNTYADWGIKKEKVLMPFAIATVLIYVVTAAFVVMKVWGVRDSDHVLFQMLVLGDWIPELTGVLAVLMTILLLGPLNFILDKIHCITDTISCIHCNLFFLIFCNLIVNPSFHDKTSNDTRFFKHCEELGVTGPNIHSHQNTASF